MGLLVGVGLVSCDAVDPPPSSPTAPPPLGVVTVGALRVGISTTGFDLDPNGYLVRVSGETGNVAQVAPSNGSVLFDSLQVGTYSATLDGVAPNCFPSGAAVRSTVVAGDTVDASLAVACEPLPRGSLEVRLSASGPPDSDGFELVVEGVRTALTGSGTVTFDDLPPGPVGVSVEGVALPCTVEPSDSFLIDIVDGDTARADLSVSCRPVGPVVIAGFHGTSHRIFASSELGEDTVSIRITDNSFGAVAWSPSGNRIAFTEAKDRSTDRRIMVINIDGENPVEVPGLPFGPSSLRWSPDGTRLAYVSAGLAVAWTSVIDSTMGGLDMGSRRAVDVDWSPDGERLLVATVDTLWIVSADGSQWDYFGSRSSGIGGGHLLYGRWSPLSDRIAHTYWDGAGYPLVVSDLDGSNSISLTRADFVAPRVRAWSADEAHVLYTVGIQVSTVRTDGASVPFRVGTGYAADWR